MTKNEFLQRLRNSLDGLPQIEIDKSAAYYNEIISDRIEDGMSEEEAVAVIGSPEAAAGEIKYSMPLGTLIKSRVAEVKNKAIKKIPFTPLVIVAICTCFIWVPILFALTVAFAAIVIAVYAVIFALFVAMYAIEVGLAAGGLFWIGGSVYCFAQVSVPSGLFSLGIALAAIGLSLLLFKPLNLAAKSTIRSTVKVARRVKGLFIKKNKEAAI